MLFLGITKFLIHTQESMFCPASNACPDLVWVFRSYLNSENMLHSSYYYKGEDAHIYPKIDMQYMTILYHTVPYCTILYSTGSNLHVRNNSISCQHHIDQILDIHMVVSQNRDPKNDWFIMANPIYKCMI